MLRIPWPSTLVEKGLTFLLPYRCLHCKEPTPTSHSLCGKCWSQLVFVTSPFCDICGFPFDFIPSSPLCAVCSSHPPPFEKGRSALHYNEMSKALLLQFKHGDALHLTSFLGSLLLPLLYDFLSDPKNSLIIPVPLHPFRLFKRQYNQAALLAQYLHKKLALPYLPTVLSRSRYTSSQGHLSFPQRHKNVKNAFSINSAYLSLVKGKTIFLIDDVWTSGATFSAATKILLNAGVTSVYVFSVARVFRI